MNRRCIEQPDVGIGLVDQHADFRAAENHGFRSSILARDGRWATPRVEPDFQGIPRVVIAQRRESASG